MYDVIFSGWLLKRSTACPKKQIFDTGNTPYFKILYLIDVWGHTDIWGLHWGHTDVQGCTNVQESIQMYGAMQMYGEIQTYRVAYRCMGAYRHMGDVKVIR